MNPRARAERVDRNVLPIWNLPSQMHWVLRSSSLDHRLRVEEVHIAGGRWLTHGKKALRALAPSVHLIIVSADREGSTFRADNIVVV